MNQFAELWSRVDPALISNLAWCLVLVTLLAWIGRRMERRVAEGVDDLTQRHKIRRLFARVRGIAYLLVLLIMLGPRIPNAGVFLGILGAGLTLSVQESVLCLVGWGMVLWNRPFEIGDRIEIADLQGDVIDVNPFFTSLLEVGNWVDGDQSTGRVATIPNSTFVRKPAFNFSQGFPFVWSEFAVVVTFESDRRRARELILAAAGEDSEAIAREVRKHLDHAQRRFPIQYRRLDPIVYTWIADSGVQLTVRYLCPVRRRRTMDHELSERILDAFDAEASVQLAYSTYRLVGVSGRAPRVEDAPGPEAP